VTDEEPSLQQLELQLKQEELRLKQAEVRVREREATASKWSNPVFLGLVAAAVGLFGNVIVTWINSTNTQQLERSRTQSNLILEAIKPSSDSNAVCKNLVFLASLGLIDDRNHVIAGGCPGNAQGVPSASVGTPDYLNGQLWYPLRVQALDANGAPIPDAKAEASLVPIDAPDQPSYDLTLGSPGWRKVSPNRGEYLGTTIHPSVRCTSDKDGNCYLGMAPAGRFLVILAKKDGYIANRTNILFNGTSVVVLLQKEPLIR
jgi:hypothetical protein